MRCHQTWIFKMIWSGSINDLTSRHHWNDAFCTGSNPKIVKLFRWVDNIFYPELKKCWSIWVLHPLSDFNRKLLLCLPGASKTSVDSSASQLSAFGPLGAYIQALGSNLQAVSCLMHDNQFCEGNPLFPPKISYFYIVILYNLLKTI